jgi:hypothetical protein
MADEPQEDLAVIEDQPAAPGGDVDMSEGGVAPDGENDNAGELPFAEDTEDAAAEPRTTFISYLTSPVVTLLVGSGGEETILTAHQALLAQSPFFAEACAAFSDDGSVGTTIHHRNELGRRILETIKITLLTRKPIAPTD